MNIHHERPSRHSDESHRNAGTPLHTPASPQWPAPDERLTPANVVALQQIIGNQAVQRLVGEGVNVSGPLPPRVQRLGVDFMQMCVTPEYIKSMSDDDIAKQLKSLNSKIQGMDQTDLTYLTAVENIKTMKQEVDRRKMTGEITPKLDAVRKATTTAAYQKATDDLIAYTKDQLDKYPDLITKFIQQKEPTATEKVRTIGEVTARVARMQFLLGTIYYKGAKDWEVNAKGKHTENRGHIVDVFGKKNAGPWCSKFATTVMSMISGHSSMFAASGYKIANPGEFKGIDLDYNAAQGGAFTGQKHGSSATAKSNPWAALRGQLEAVDKGKVKGKTKAEIVDAFLQKNIQPQPGDLMILRRGGGKQNAFKGAQSHTTVIERVDGRTLSTIEGNIGKGKVGGRTYDLTKAGDVEEIIFIARPSLASGLSKADQKKIGTVATSPADSISQYELTTPLDNINQLLETLAEQEGYLKQVKAGDNNAVANIEKK